MPVALLSLCRMPMVLEWNRAHLSLTLSFFFSAGGIPAMKDGVFNLHFSYICVFQLKNYFC